MMSTLYPNAQKIPRLACVLVSLLCLIIFFFCIPKITNKLLLNLAVVSCLKELIPFNAFDSALSGQFSSTICGSELSKFELIKQMNVYPGDAMFWMGYISWVQGNISGVENTMNITMEPNHVDMSRLIAGIALEQTGHIGSAEATLRQINAPIQAMTKLGDHLALQGDCNRAEIYYQMAIRQPESDLWQPYMGLAECHFKTGQLKEAAQEYETAFKFGLKDAVIANRLGKILTAINHPKESIPWFMLALRWHSYPIYMIDLAKGFEAIGDRPKAEYWLSETERTFPQTPEGFWEYGNYYYREGRYKDAIIHYQNAVALSPQGPYYFYSGLGQAYWSLGCAEKAITAFSQALRLDPENGVVNNWLQSAKSSKELNPAACP